MEVLASFSNIKEDIEFEFDPSEYSRGGLQVAWEGTGDGRVALQVDLDLDREWENYISESLSQSNELNLRFTRPLFQKSRIKLDLFNGSLDRLAIFIVGKKG